MGPTGAPATGQRRRAPVVAGSVIRFQLIRLQDAAKWNGGGMEWRGREREMRPQATKVQTRFGFKHIDQKQRWVSLDQLLTGSFFPLLLPFHDDCGARLTNLLSKAVKLTIQTTQSQPVQVTVPVPVPVPA